MKSKNKFINLFNFLKQNNYKFSKCLDKFQNQLLFKGITYYDRHYVFEHLNPYCPKELLDFQIKRIELDFNKEKLNSIWLFVDINAEELNLKMSKIFEATSVKSILDPYGKTYYTPQFYWTDLKYLIGIGLINQETFLLIGLKKEYLYFFNFQSTVN